MRLTYNSPAVLNFSLLSFIAFLVCLLNPNLNQLFVVFPTFHFNNPLDYLRVFSHVIGHKNWAHFVGNFTFILLIGPLLEEKYGSRYIMYLILITAFTTGLINILFFSTALMGASGVVFVFIVLASFTNHNGSDIPLTFILITIIFIAKEFANLGSNDGISHIAHLIGAGIGCIFGFTMRKRHLR